MLKISPGDMWDLLIKECPKCCSSPLTVTPEGDDDYLIDCGDCELQFRVTSEDGEEGLVSDVLRDSKQCACGSSR